jgi:EAL domain-containing protein (putative c-di-GMP-specific phosphodiesterase class I)
MPNHQPLHEAIRIAADPLAVLQRIVDQAIAMLPQADGASLEVRREADRLEYLVAAGTLASHVGLRLPVQGSFSGLSLRSGRVEICRDALADSRVDRAAVLATGVRSMLCVPLSNQLESVAVLKVSSAHPDAFTNADAERLRVLTNFVAVMVSAASALATVTADVLADLDRIDTAEPAGLDWPQATARFVASVMTPGLVDRVEWLNRIQMVLAEEALDIVFQPIVDLRSGRMVGCEALSRFRSPQAEPPDWWFAAAERVDLGVELELLAMRRALAEIPMVPAHLHVSVNAGPRTILHPQFPDLVRTAELSRLVLELTEHASVPDYAALVSVLEPLRAGGMRLSVDDTGSGYAGLTHLHQLNPDVIKLDRSLIAGVHADPVRRALTTAMACFAVAIGGEVIAEGLEQQADVDCLRQLGIHQVQGFLFWRPMPLAELVRRAAEDGRP